MSLGLILGVIAAVIKYYKVGQPKLFAVLAFAIVGIGVILCFVFKKDKGKVTFDERDKLIERNAYYVGLGAVYLLVILVSYVPIGIAPEARIPTKWFPFLFPSVVLCQVFAQSIAILIQYGWRDKGNE